MPTNYRGSDSNEGSIKSTNCPATTQPGPEMSPVQPSYVCPASADGSKRVLAGVLIAVFSLMLLGANATVSKGSIPEYIEGYEALGYLIGQATAVVLIIIGLIFSIKWERKLAGYRNTTGRQAVAIFLIAFFCWGLLLCVIGTVMLAEEAAIWIPVTVGLLYIGACYASIRWLRKLKRSER